MPSKTETKLYESPQAQIVLCVMAKGVKHHGTRSSDRNAALKGSHARRLERSKDMHGKTPGVNMRSFYLISASRDHVLSAREQSIVQANHGVKAPLQRMRPGDGVVFYSARHQLRGKEPCQRFTAIATVADGDVYQERVSETWKPWRRPAVFDEHFREIDVKEVLGRLECLGRGRGSWGVYLRRGFIKMSGTDWEVLVGPCA